MAAKANPTRIQRAGNGHSYFLDGDRVPGVTTILGDGMPKPGLIGWAANVTAEFVVNRLAVATNSEGKQRIVADELIADLREWNRTRQRPTRWSDADTLPRSAISEVLANVRYRDLDEASGKGTDVHKFAEQLARGEEVDVPEILAGHVDSYLRFLDEWQPYDALLERVVVNRRWRYMGKFDLLAYFDSVPTWIAERVDHGPPFRGLLDVKTSRSGIYAETALQLEGYRNAETMLVGADEEPMPSVDFTAAIHVRHDGYSVHAFDVERVRKPTTFDVFLYVMQVARWNDWKQGPASTIRSDALTPPHPSSPRSEPQP